MSDEQQLYLFLLSEDAHVEEIAELTRRLRRELLEVDVEEVEFAKAAELPAGAKSLGAIDWGTLILTVAGSGTAAFVGVKLALSSFLQRHPHTKLVIERPDGTLITLEGEFRPGTPLYDQFLAPPPAAVTPSPSAEPARVTGDEIQGLVEILTGLSEFRRPNSRYDTVEGWLTDSPRERDLVMILDLEGAPHIAARRLVQKLVEFGQDSAGHEALGWVVKGLLKEPGLGEDQGKRLFLDRLLAKLAGNASEVTLPTDEQVDIVALRRMMVEALSMEDVKTIVFDMLIDYHQLAGETKGEKIQALILFAQRQKRLPELVMLCKKANDKVDWPEL